MSDEWLKELFAAVGAEPEPETADTVNPLTDKLRARIRATGPMTLHDYMEACLADPEHGYYLTRDPFGTAGDFITAPDLCQAFGELIGLWCVHVWAELGEPAGCRLVELGPGRGALMSDALRAASLVPGFLASIDVHFVETSPRLREAQGERLRMEAKEHGRTLPALHWHDSLDDVPAGPTFLVANEFVDALPVRQFERRDGQWFERLVTLDDTDAFVYGLTAEPLAETDLLPPASRQARDGDCIELRPAGETTVETLARRATGHPFAGLIIDYGYGDPALGDTFQAVRAHEYADPLQTPGQNDLTAHVDFSELKRFAGQKGLACAGPVTQRDFLLSLGIRERAAQLMQAMESIQSAHRFITGLQRLIEPEQMGTLFKVMALTGSDQPVVPGFEALQDTGAATRPGEENGQ